MSDRVRHIIVSQHQEQTPILPLQEASAVTELVDYSRVALGLDFAIACYVVTAHRRNKGTQYHRL